MLETLALIALLLPAQPGSPSDSKLLNVLFSMYVADPAVMRAWQQASGKG